MPGGRTGTRTNGKPGAGAGRGSGLVPPPARFLSAAPSCAGFLGVNCSKAARTGSFATPTAGGEMYFWGAGWYPAP